MLQMFCIASCLLMPEVIGTFAGHPFVMASMNAFLKWLLDLDGLPSVN